MNYLKNFFRANGLQVLTYTLGCGDGYVLVHYPQYTPYLTAVAGLLLLFGIHIEPLVWKPTSIAVRLAKPAAGEITVTEVTK